MDSKAVIMAHHGAVCYGKDSEEAFNVAATLERESALYVLEQFDRKFGEKIADLSEMCASWAQKHGKTIVKHDETCYNNSYRDASGKIVFYAAGDKEHTVTVDPATSAVSGEGEIPTAELHRAIYEARDDINAILYSQAPRCSQLPPWARLLNLSLMTAPR